MANILLTGGRAPATLDLARSFHAQGHRVTVAESLPNSLTAASNATHASFVLPPPRQQPAAFVEALADIIRQQQIDLLIPTCEEIFYVAMGREKLAGLCTVFAEPIERLRTLHNKCRFIQTAEAMGLPVPGTVPIETEADLRAAFEHWPRLVLKPVYSRFASRTLILPPASTTFASLCASSASPWVAQEYLTGQPLCTYSIAHAGRLTAHTTYRSIFTAGQGATIHFQHVDHRASLAWVRRFVETFGFTGQIAFDFVETDGTVRAIECNPRATSGIHLLAAAAHFPDTFFDGEMECLFPPAQPAPMLSAAMLLYGLPAALKNNLYTRIEKNTDFQTNPSSFRSVYTKSSSTLAHERAGGTGLKKPTLGHWWQAFHSGRDVIFRWNDMRPTFAQWQSILHFISLGWRRGITALEASTLDIEWNGEM